MEPHLAYTLRRLAAEFNMATARPVDLFAKKGKRPVVLINYATTAISIRRGGSSLPEIATAARHCGAPLDKAHRLYERRTPLYNVRFLVTDDGLVWKKLFWRPLGEDLGGARSDRGARPTPGGAHPEVAEAAGRQRGGATG